jgi:hypothetical protein
MSMKKTKVQYMLRGNKQQQSRGLRKPTKWNTKFRPKDKIWGLPWCRIEVITEEDVHIFLSNEKLATEGTKWRKIQTMAEPSI